MGTDVYVFIAAVAFVPVAVVAIGIAVVLSSRRSHAAVERRKAELAAVAARLGYEYLPEDQSILGWFASMPFYPQVTLDDTRPNFTCVMRGHVGRTPVLLFDMMVYITGSESFHHYRQTVAMFYLGDAGLPCFQLERRGLDAAADRACLPVNNPSPPPVALPGQPDFTARFRLRAPDASAMQRWLTPRRRAALAAHADWSVESTGAWLAVCRKGHRPAIADYPAFASEATAFLAALATPESGSS